MPRARAAHRGGRADHELHGGPGTLRGTIAVGEAEEIVAEMAADLENGRAKPIYQAKELPGLDRTPLPDLDLIQTKHYSSMAIQYSRGCPFNCEFCDIIEIYGRVPRAKSPDASGGELEVVLASGWRGGGSSSSTTTSSAKAQGDGTAPVIAPSWSRSTGGRFTFFTEASRTSRTTPLLHVMGPRVSTRVFLGSRRPPRNASRKRRRCKSHEAVCRQRAAHQSYGIEVMAGFIVGFDNDPEDIFDRQVNFIQESAIPLAMVGLLQALPGTQG